MLALKNRAEKREKFEIIFRDYNRRLFLYAVSFNIPDEEAEDIVQEIFANLWKDDTYLKIEPSAIKTYLFRSIKNGCLNRLEKKDILRDSLDVYKETITEDIMFRLNDDLIEEINIEIENMPSRTREIIKRIFFDEMTYQEVADHFEVSINTVKTLLKNGMKHLRECFAERVDLFLLFHIECFKNKKLN